MLLLDTNILIDRLRGEAPALAWLEQQQRPRISVISWIEVLVGCREGESGRVQAWLDTFPRLPLDDAIALESVRLRQRHGLQSPDAIILATARCADLISALPPATAAISRSRWVVCCILTGSEGGPHTTDWGADPAG
jgi:predicted nucleic acid-binding protein